MSQIDTVFLQNEQARLLREKGIGYKRIANITGMNKDRVRYVCRDIRDIQEDTELFYRMEAKEACAYCGGELEQHEGSGRPRRFCTDYCRRQYWRLHRSEQKKREDKLFIRTCAYCGKTFQIYGKNDRKYCCREHYRLHFYGEPYGCPAAD